MAWVLTQFQVSPEFRYSWSRLFRILAQTSTRPDAAWGLFLRQRIRPGDEKTPQARTEPTNKRRKIGVALPLGGDTLKKRRPRDVILVDSERMSQGILNA